VPTYQSATFQYIVIYVTTEQLSRFKYKEYQPHILIYKCFLDLIAFTFTKLPYKNKMKLTVRAENDIIDISQSATILATPWRKNDSPF
jgi:hypothetical protein